MSDQIIPLDAAPNQSFKVTVNVGARQVSLGVTLRYSEPAAYWVMTLVDEAGNLLLDSVPLVTGQFPAANILGQYQHLEIGSAYVVNASSVPAPDYPNNLDLGTDFLLAWGDQVAFAAPSTV